MGQRITQRIYTCDICGETPDDGEYMWHMGNEIWCEKCCDESGKREYALITSMIQQNKND